MARKKSVFILPKLKDCGGDLTKKWYVEYSLRDPQTGEMKRFRHYEGFAELATESARRAHAEKVISTIKNKLNSGEDPFAENHVTYQDELMYQAMVNRWGNNSKGAVSIRVHISEFLQLKKAELAHSSYQTYCSKLRIFCEWVEAGCLANKNVRVISEEHIHNFFYHIVGTGHVSRRTVLKYKQLLHTFFDYLLHKKLVVANPVTNIPNLGEKRDDPQLLLLCQLEYYCAIRPKECLYLQIRDINLETASITIRQDISKNGLTETVNMPRQLYEVLDDLLKIGNYPEDWYLFSRDGQPGKHRLGKNTFRYRFDRIRDKLGLSKRYKLYSFKHTGGVKLVNAGVNTWEIQKHFRHKSITTTERYLQKRFGVKSSLIQEDFPDM